MGVWLTVYYSTVFNFTGMFMVVRTWRVEVEP